MKKAPDTMAKATAPGARHTAHFIGKLLDSLPPMRRLGSQSELLRTLDELADLAGMSRARFAVNFREAAGMTPLDYLTDWRMSVARNLIREGRPIKSVAIAVGYQSQAALTRVFSKRVGCSPTEWMRLA